MSTSLAAPGAHLVSLSAPGSVVDSAHAASRVGSSYFLGSGTSFATAVTSGSVATLLARGAGGRRWAPVGAAPRSAQADWVTAR